MDYGGPFTTLDIVFMALVGVVFGTIFAFSAPVNHFLTSVLGVWGETIISWYMAPQALAALIVRKRGAYFITTGINMLTQALAGNPAGFAPIVGWWLFGGTGGELVLWLVWRYQKWGFVHLAIAVAVNLLVNWPVSFWFYGWGSQGVFANIAGTIAQMFTFGIEGAGIAWILARLLYRAGLLGGFNYAKDVRQTQMEEAVAA
jgi:ABC-type thiamin/hydroxymethylpyrimidine transport system permease subunit